MTIIHSTGNSVDILDNCTGEVWKAAIGAIGEDAEIMIDMQCPVEFQKIELINGAGDFLAKGFSVFGSHASTGPWMKLFTGELGSNKV